MSPLMAIVGSAPVLHIATAHVTPSMSTKCSASAQPTSTKQSASVGNWAQTEASMGP